jgi:putative sigma-54 modulation protein
VTTGPAAGSYSRWRAFNEDGLEELVEMKVGVRTPGSDASEAVRTHVEQRLLFALARFEGWVQDVNVHLTDLNGSRGRFERRCHMGARLVPWGAVRVEGTADDLYAAINHAADRLGRCVAHELARRGRLKISERVGVHREW